MLSLSPRLLWSAMTAGCLFMVAVSFVLTDWLHLNPCHLCIFQRLLYLMLIPPALLAALLTPHPAARIPGLLTLPLAAAGAAAAGYQGWLQREPLGTVSCVGGQPDPIELAVEWLGQRMPELFLATGFCEDPELIILGLSLADWSLLGYIGCLLAAAWALWPRPRAQASPHPDLSENRP
ncbi:MAG: disulfide bond formation protein B [Chromatiaceae bacterium]|nr:MAG: disulfide bond formation protein B [Chromatiaceae bacterium]